MNKDQLTIGNCPHCTNTIFRDGSFGAEATFSIRCPYCKKFVRVEIITKVEIRITPIPQKHGQFGSKQMLIILILFLPPLINFMIDFSDVLDTLA